MRELVALALPGGARFVEELADAWERGDAVLPVDLRLPEAAWHKMFAALGPAWLIDERGRHRLDPEAARPTEDGDALVVATSGTTGEPKGVVHTHVGVAASAKATSAYLGIDGTRHHWLACLPLAHIGGLSVICRARWAGTKLTVLPGFDADVVAASDATHVSLVPTALARLGDSAERFERIVLGGSAPPEVRGANVVCTYGLTETGSGVVYDGWPLPGVEVREVDGELFVRGPMLLRAYRNGHDPKDEDGWLATGDAGSVDPASGFVEVFGRRDDLIITGAQKVWPDPVEKILIGMDGVAEVAIVGRPHPEWGQQVTAVVVADGTPPTLAAMRDAVKAQLAPYCAPHAVEYADELPRTALGKVRRRLV